MKLHKGDFNYQGECFRLYTHAKTYDEAYSNFCHKLAVKIGISWTAVYAYFLQTSKDNYLVMEVKNEKTQN